MRSNGYNNLSESHWIWAVVIILLLAYGLRLTGLTSESLWIDEGYSLALATHNIYEILQGTAADQHPPLYYLLLHLWLLVVKGKNSVFLLRYFSVLTGILSVASIAALGRSLLNRRAGFIAALLVSCSPMHIWYSQEARMYILLLFLTTISAHGLWRLLLNRKGWSLFFINSFLSLYTHYFSVIFLLFANTVALIRQVIAPNTKFLERWLIIQIMLFLGFGPWLPIAIYQARYHQMKWIGPPTIERIGSTLFWMMLGDSQPQQNKLLSAGGLALLIIAIAWLICRAFTISYQVPLNYLFLLLWFVIPFGIVIIVSLEYPIFQPKQFLMLLSPLILLLSSALTNLPRTFKLLIVMILGFFIISSLFSLYNTNTKHGWREVASYIEGNYRPGDLLYLNPAAGMLPLDVYLHMEIPYEGYPPGYDVIKGGWVGETVTADIANQIMKALSTKYKRIWLVEFVPTFWDPEAQLVAWLEKHGTRLDERDFQGVHVYLYDFQGQINSD
ncbi:MAG: glycosyltransferase family 39 protein [Halobacteria archaeon]